MTVHAVIEGDFLFVYWMFI